MPLTPLDVRGSFGTETQAAVNSRKHDVKVKEKKVLKIYNPCFVTRNLRHGITQIIFIFIEVQTPDR